MSRNYFLTIDSLIEIQNKFFPINKNIEKICNFLIFYITCFRN